MSRVDLVHLRRALLLFAMVLGFAALAATISQAPRREESRRGAAAAPVPTPDVRPPVQLELSAKGRRRSIRLATGSAATLTVSVPEPGQVELEEPKAIAAAQPSTPATFPLLIERPGRYPVRFTPTASGEVRRIGTLVVRPG